MSETAWDDMRADLVARVGADEYCSDITVLSERIGNLTEEIKKRLGTITEKGGKIGICIVFGRFSGICDKPNIPGPFLRGKFAVRVLENVLINESDVGTKKPALAVSMRVQKIIHHYRHPGVCGLVLCESEAHGPVEDPFASTAYELKFAFTDPSAAVVLKCSEPFISPNSGTHPATLVAMSCPTTGATITYTLDGTSPYAPNPTALIWTGAPVAIADACTVKAVASKTGQISSNVTIALFN